MYRLSTIALLPLSLCLSMPLHAQDAPKVSPEEAAMMEAYQKAGTPSVAHANTRLRSRAGARRAPRRRNRPAPHRAS